jgi:hypothetical protein
MEKLTKNTILKNTTNKELFSLFKDFQNRLIEKNKDAGIFSVDDDEPIFDDSDLRKIIKDMIK